MEWLNAQKKNTDIYATNKESKTKAKKHGP